MKFLKTLPIVISMFSGVSLADTIVLKSGEKIEGHVISEDSKSYLVEINVTKSIKDEKRIPKESVKEIIKEKEDTIAFSKVAKLVPTPDKLSSSGYQVRIKAARDFITEFPQSTLVPQVQESLKTLESEYKVISSGGIKLDGQIIPKSDLEANAYEIHARILLNEITELTHQGNHRLALLKWEKLKSDYKNSSSFPKAIPIVTRALRTYHFQLKQMLDTMEVRTQKRDNALQTMTQNDRSRTLAVLDEQKKNYAALLEKEKNQLKLKWLTVDPYMPEAIKQNHQKAEAELKSINNIKLDELKQAGPLYRATWTALANNNLEDASTNLKELTSIRIPAQYTDPFKEDLKQRQESKKEAARRAREAAAIEKARQARLAKEAAEKAAEKADEESKKKPRKKRKKKTAKP